METTTAGNTLVCASPSRGEAYHAANTLAFITFRRQDSTR